jgi:hypothetical protein
MKRSAVEQESDPAGQQIRILEQDLSTADQHDASVLAQAVSWGNQDAGTWKPTMNSVTKTTLVWSRSQHADTRQTMNRKCACMPEQVMGLPAWNRPRFWSRKRLCSNKSQCC